MSFLLIGGIYILGKWYIERQYLQVQKTLPTSIFMRKKK